MVKHLNIKIYGLVQGVNFRFFAQQQAQIFKISGSANNLSDGTLYLEVEGEEKNLGQFLAACQKGPESARVEKIKTTEGKVKNFADFKI